MIQEHTKPIDPDCQLIANPKIILQEETDRWGFLYHPDKNFTMGMNPESIFLWKQLQQPTTITEITTKIKKHFKAVPHEIEQEILNMVVGLVKIDFASLSNPAPTSKNPVTP